MQFDVRYNDQYYCYSHNDVDDGGECFDYDDSDGG